MPRARAPAFMLPVSACRAEISDLHHVVSQLEQAINRSRERISEQSAANAALEAHAQALQVRARVGRGALEQGRGGRTPQRPTHATRLLSPCAHAYLAR
jgi:hypothetical protein